MLSSHTLCLLVSEAVCPAGGYNKGSLRRACLVGLIPGRSVFLVSIICRSQTEDMSEQDAGECWARESTAASEQTQLLCAFNSLHFTGELWLRQEISPPDAAAPTCTTDHTGERSSPGWGRGRDGWGHCSPPVGQWHLLLLLPTKVWHILLLKIQRAAFGYRGTRMLWPAVQ